MKSSGLVLLYENKEIIISIIVLSIIFFIYWDKNNKQNLPLTDKQTNNFKKKWYDISYMDIISSKVSIILFLIIALLLLLFKS